MKIKVCAWVSLVLVGLEVLLILASWIVTSAMPELPMRSLLGSGGIRWFFGHFTESLNTTFFVDAMLLVIGGGTVIASGLSSALHDILSRKRLRYLDRVGLWVVLVELVVFLVVVILLTLVPHAILLSVTGHLFPSSFSNSLIPIISFILLVCSLSFGIISNRFNSIEQVYESIIYGLKRFAWVVPIYVFAMELYSSIIFVFAI